MKHDSFPSVYEPLLPDDCIELSLFSPLQDLVSSLLDDSFPFAPKGEISIKLSIAEFPWQETDFVTSWNYGDGLVFSSPFLMLGPTEFFAGWTLQWDGTRNNYNDPVRWVLDNIVIFKPDPPANPPAKPPGPPAPKPVSPLPGVGGVGDGSASLFAPYEPKTPEEAREALRLIQLELQLISGALTDLAFARLLSILGKLFARLGGYERYVRKVAGELPTGAGKCAEATREGLRRIPGSTRGTVRDPKKFAHNWIELPDGRIIDTTLRKNLLEYIKNGKLPANTPVPPAGKKIFSPKEHSQFMDGWPTFGS